MSLLGTFQPRLVAIHSVVLLSNGPELALHRHNIENKKKTCINIIPCSARTISSFCQTIIFFDAISIHCGGCHPVSVMVNTLFLEYTSCCCSTSSLRNMPPAASHLKIFRPVQPYRLSACHLSM